MDECPPNSTSSPAKAIIVVFDFSHSDRYKMVCQSCFDFHFLIDKEDEHDLKCLLAIWTSSVENSLFSSVLHFLIGLIRILKLIKLYFFDLFIYFLFIKNFYLLPTSHFPTSPHTPHPLLSPVLIEGRVPYPVRSPRFSPLHPGLGRWASKQTRVPQSQSMQ